MKNRLISLSLSVLMLFALLPEFSTAAADTDGVDVMAYSYTVQPILSPFCYYVYVKTNNPDPTSFRLIDRSSVYDGDSGHGYYELADRLFADVKYEDETTYRVKDGYLFRRAGYSAPDGGTLILQQKSGGGYRDTTKKISCAKMKRTQDYLIDTFTTGSMSFFEKMDAVQAALDQLAVYPHGVYDSDRPNSMTPYPFLATSPYVELTLNEHYEMYDDYAGGMLLMSAFPFVLDSLAFPGLLGNVAKTLDDSAQITNGNNHYTIKVTYQGKTRSYGGVGSGSYDPIYTARVKKSFLFDGSSKDLARIGSIDQYEDLYWTYNQYSSEDAAAYRDQIAGDTFVRTIRASGGTWIRVGSEPWFSGSVPPQDFSYVIPRDDTFQIVSDAWVDGRYVDAYEAYLPDAAFSDYPNADIVVRQMSYTDDGGVKHQQDVLFQYDGTQDLWDASDYYYTTWDASGALPDAFQLTRSEVKKMKVDANSAFYPTKGLIYDSSAEPGTAFQSISAAGISIPKSMTISLGDQKRITATFSPANATNQTLIWRSDNENIVLAYDALDAAHPNQGEISAVSPGKATVTAMSRDGSFTASCVVTVKAEGTYGDATYSFDVSTGQMTIGGNGRMGEYFVNAGDGPAPWLEIKDQIQSMVIKDGVTSVGSGTFSDCPNLKKVSIGSCVTDIYYAAFANSGVTSFSVSKNNPEYSSAGGVIFNKDRTELVCFPSGKSGAYEIPDGVRSVGFFAFFRCPKLTSVKLSASVSMVYDTSFRGCTALTAFSVDENNSSFASVGGVLFDKEKTTLLRYPQAKAGAYSIPAGTKILQSTSFFECTKLTTVSLPIGLTEIGYSAFGYCTGLTRAVLSKDVSSIGSYAFQQCTALKTVFIPQALTSLPNVFYGCSRLRQVFYEGTETQWSQITVDYTDEINPLDAAAVYYASVFLTQQPKNVTAAVGTTANYTVKARGSGLKYQWQYKTPSGSWTDCTAKTRGYNKATLNVSAEEKRNNYLYRCKVSDSNGGYVYTRAAKLIVKTLSILTQPKAASVNVGETAAFSVKAAGTGLTYQWQYQTASGSWTDCTSKTTGYHKATLKVVGTKARNGYRYRCVVRDEANNTVISKAVTLTVQNLSITAQPKPASVKTTDYAAFTVKATGADLTYQWQYRKPGGSWTDCTSKTEGYHNAVLKVQGVTGDVNRDGYQYRCRITDGAKNVITSSAVKLSVLSITLQPKAASVTGSNCASFAVNATGCGIKYQWQYRKPGGNWTDCTAKTEGYQKDSLKVQGVTGSTNRNGYQYRCKITDSAGNTVISNSVKLTVK